MNKLIYITNVHMPTGRAFGGQIMKMCAMFADSGINVELIHLKKEGISESDIFGYFGMKKDFSLKAVKLYNFLKLEKYIGRLSFYLQGLLFLIKLIFIKLGKNSVIYTRQPEIAWLMKLRGFVACYECHDGIKNKKFLLKKLLKKVDYIIVTNSFIKDDFVKNGFKSNKIFVAPNGVDINNFDINVSKEDAIKNLNLEKKLLVSFKNKKILMYTGNFKTKGVTKGIDEILKALALLKNPNLVFLAVGGSAPEIVYYKQMAIDIGVDGVYFLPRQSQVDLALFQKSADILLMPFPKLAHYEYFMSPLKMFEYMASKRPIIASNLPSIKEVLNDHNAFLVKEGDVEDLAKGIEGIINNEQFAQNIAERAFKDVQKYSWKERAKNIHEFIKS